MKRIILWEMLFVLVLGAILVALFWKKNVKDVPLAEVEEAYLTRTDFGTMTRYGDMTLRRNFALDADSFAEYVYYGQSDTMSVGTLLIVKSRVEEDGEAVRSAIDVYLERERKAFDGYGETQTALLKDARIYQNGVYTALIVSEQADAWEKLLKRELEE